MTADRVVAGIVAIAAGWIVFRLAGVAPDGRGHGTHEQLGMDPVHFGIILVMNLCIGLCTPPVGSVLFVGCGVAGTRIEEVSKPLLPFFLAMICALLAVTYIPQLSLALPAAQVRDARGVWQRRERSQGAPCGGRAAGRQVHLGREELHHALLRNGLPRLEIGDVVVHVVQQVVEQDHLPA